MEASWSAPTSIRRRPRKVGFYLYWPSAYDLEGLLAGTRHHEMWKRVGQANHQKIRRKVVQQIRHK
ncbi:hypothetical protein BED47_10965 [Gottfriedia luciferensis]|uniref:Uncharacterized protein n=1 Tax=Gottfriedia luciferensis TaxID=178774 RepID=A0ABX2ZTK9_9BACI|nr:hypothetical protein BED47_10965 [Gottfriedia luciferensis]